VHVVIARLIRSARRSKGSLNGGQELINGIAVLLAGAVAYVRRCYERGWSVTDLIDGCSIDVQAAGFMSARLTKTELGRKRLFNREERHAIDLVNDYWDLVEAVAAALLRRGSLTVERVHEIIIDTL
jgi:hypothetical protein